MSNIKFKKEPRVLVNITEALYNDLLSLVNSTDLEITLVLELEKIDKYNFKIKNYFIPPQWNESAESKTLDSQYPKWCIEQIKEGHKLNGHMHSHPQFSVTPSGYDTKFFDELVEETNSYQARFIINQKGFITADIINEEDNYIAEGCTVKIICDNFNILADATSIKPYIEGVKDIMSNIIINKDLTVSLRSSLLTLTTDELIYTETVKYTPVRKADTDEGYKTPYYTGYGVGYNNKSPDGYLYKPHNPMNDPLYKESNYDWYGYTDEELKIARDNHMTPEELEEYLLEMEEFENANTK